MEMVFSVISNVIIIIYFVYQDKRLVFEEEYSLFKRKNIVLRYGLKIFLAILLVFFSFEFLGISYDLRALYLALIFVLPHKKFELLATGATLIVTEYILVFHAAMYRDVVFILIALLLFSVLSKTTKFIDLSRKRQLQISMAILLVISYVISLFIASREDYLILTLFYIMRILVTFVFVELINNEVGNIEDLLYCYYIEYQTGLRDKRIFDKNFNSFCKGNLSGVAGIIDIDFFKIINDTYGHDVGDQVIKNFGKMLRNYQTNKISFYRIGGDEFGVLVVDTSSEDVVAMFKEILNKLNKKPIATFMDTEVFITLSVGLNCVDQKIEPQKVFSKIDAEMYRAKKRGRNQISLCE